MREKVGLEIQQCVPEMTGAQEFRLSAESPTQLRRRLNSFDAKGLFASKTRWQAGRLRSSRLLR